VKDWRCSEGEPRVRRSRPRARRKTMPPKPRAMGAAGDTKRIDRRGGFDAAKPPGALGGDSATSSKFLLDSRKPAEDRAQRRPRERFMVSLRRERPDRPSSPEKPWNDAANPSPTRLGRTARRIRNERSSRRHGGRLGAAECLSRFSCRGAVVSDRRKHARAAGDVRTSASRRTLGAGKMAVPGGRNVGPGVLAAGPQTGGQCGARPPLTFAPLLPARHCCLTTERAELPTILVHRVTRRRRAEQDAGNAQPAVFNPETESSAAMRGRRAPRLGWVPDIADPGRARGHAGPGCNAPAPFSPGPERVAGHHRTVNRGNAATLSRTSLVGRQRIVDRAGRPEIVRRSR